MPAGPALGGTPVRVPATLIVSALVLLLGGCATDRAVSQTSASSLDFALIGDMPYDGRQEKEFANLMKDIDAAELAFVVHNGDFWWDGQAWTEKSGGLPPPVPQGPGEQGVVRLPPGQAAYIRSARPSGKAAQDVLPGRRQSRQAADEADPPEREQPIRSLPRERALDLRRRHVPHAAYDRKQ